MRGAGMAPALRGSHSESELAPLSGGTGGQTRGSGPARGASSGVRREHGAPAAVGRGGVSRDLGNRRRRTGDDYGDFDGDDSDDGGDESAATTATTGDLGNRTWGIGDDALGGGTGRQGEDFTRMRALLHHLARRELKLLYMHIHI